jgi:hypothetical protein
MARPKSKAPQRRYHLSGQSVVTIDGKDYYLGTHDSPESIARYAVLIAEYQRHDFKLPEDFDLDSIKDRAGLILGEPVQHQEQQPVRVCHVTACFLQWASVRFSGQSQDFKRIKKLVEEIDQHYGNLLVSQFGPLKLQEQRQRWVDTGISRRYCNRQTNLVIRMFKHGVGQELVSPETWQRLKAVEPLRYGATTAPETDPRKPVGLDVVKATIPHLSPIVRDMVRLQLVTGMRPSEVCNLRPLDIDKTGEVWMIRPGKHKTANRGIRKAVPLLGVGREIVENYLNRSPESYLFSPAEAVQWLHSKKRAERKTKVQPSQVCRKKENPMTPPPPGSL